MLISHLFAGPVPSWPSAPRRRSWQRSGGRSWRCSNTTPRRKRRPPVRVPVEDDDGRAVLRAAFLADARTRSPQSCADSLLRRVHRCSGWRRCTLADASLGRHRATGRSLLLPEARPASTPHEIAAPVPRHVLPCAASQGSRASPTRLLRHGSRRRACLHALVDLSQSCGTCGARPPASRGWPLASAHLRGIAVPSSCATSAGPASLAATEGNAMPAWCCGSTGKSPMRRLLCPRSSMS